MSLPKTQVFWYPSWKNKWVLKEEIIPSWVKESNLWSSWQPWSPEPQMRSHELTGGMSQHSCLEDREMNSGMEKHTAVGCWLFWAGPCVPPSVYSSAGSLPLSGKQLTNARVLAHSCTRKASHSTMHSSPSWAVYWQHRLLSPTKAYFSQILLFLSLRILPKDAMRPLCPVTMHLGLGWVICLGYKTVGL